MHRTWTRIVLAAALLAAALSGGLRESNAHASLVGSEPPNNAVVKAAPDVFVLTFNEPVSPLTLRLVAPGGATLELKEIAAENQSLRVTMPSKRAAARTCSATAWFRRTGIRSAAP